MNFARKTGPILVLILMLAVFISTGLSTVDFGRHWDDVYQQELIARPFQTGVFLPGSYAYGSMVFDLGSVTLAPETVPFLLRTAKAATPYYDQPYEQLVPPAKSEPMVQFVYGHRFLLRLRAVFVLVTALTGVWTYGAVLACRRSGWEAVSAAALILTSWEVAYHARWVAPDAIQMQFVALWLMLFSFALYSTSAALKWLRWVAAAAALACGTKYQGGILLLPVIAYTIVIVRRENPSSWPRLAARQIALQLGIFTLVFLASTPGSVLQPLAFVQSLREVGHIYVTGHGGYTVGRLVQHGYLLFVYLSAVFASHWPILAVIMAITAVLGALAICRQQRLVGVLLICVPLLYLLYVVRYPVMIVRNYLLLAPFFALFFARGASSIWRAANLIPWLRVIVAVIFAAIFAANGAFLVHAAVTVRHRDSISFAADVEKHLAAHGSTRYYLSPKVADLVTSTKPANVTTDTTAAEWCILFTDEVPETDWSKWLCNHLGEYHLVSGPIAVNFDYYASWVGPPMMVELKMSQARQMHLLAGL